MPTIWEFPPRETCSSKIAYFSIDLQTAEITLLSCSHLCSFRMACSVAGRTVIIIVTARVALLIKSNLFAISKVHNITVDKNYISLGWTDRRQLRTYVCP